MKGDATKGVRSGHFRNGLYGVVSDRGLNPKRVTNEDSYLLLQDVPLFAVADGVGGQNAGEVASQVVVQILKNQFLNKRAPTEKASFLDHVICYANRYLYDMAVDDELLSGMATTLAVVVLERKRAIISHVGDSRVYRFSGGKLQRETVDHSLAEESSLGDPSLNELVNKNIITRALGVEPEVLPETKTIPMTSDVTFLLCTDGITRHISDDEIETVLGEEHDPQSACEIFKEICFERGARDNLTVIVVKSEPTFWFAGGPAKDVEESPAASDQGKPGWARLHVDLANRDSIGSADPTASEPTTFSSHFSGHEEVNVKPPKEKHWVITPLLIAVALVVGFFLGFRVQPVLSPTVPTDLAGHEHVSPAEVFDEGRRAFESGDYLRALDAFTRAAALQPEKAQYYHWIARTADALAAARKSGP